MIKVELNPNDVESNSFCINCDSYEYMDIIIARANDMMDYCNSCGDDEILFSSECFYTEAMFELMREREAPCCSECAYIYNIK
jgi:hypothetical protein